MKGDVLKFSEAGHSNLEAEQGKMIHQYVTKQSAADKARKDYQVVMLVFLEPIEPSQLRFTTTF